jgi:hypothetical protein
MPPADMGFIGFIISQKRRKVRTKNVIIQPVFFCRSYFFRPARSMRKKLAEYKPKRVQGEYFFRADRGPGWSRRRLEARISVIKKFSPQRERDTGAEQLQKNAFRLLSLASLAV